METYKDGFFVDTLCFQHTVPQTVNREPIQENDDGEEDVDDDDILMLINGRYVPPVTNMTVTREKVTAAPGREGVGASDPGAVAVVDPSADAPPQPVVPVLHSQYFTDSLNTDIGFTDISFTDTWAGPYSPTDVGSDGLFPF